MRSSRLALILILVAAFALAAPAGSQAELRFGPWVYWAPYYYPSPEKLRALGFKPEAFAPRYQSPNPLPPGSEGECMPAPPPRPRKVASRPPRAHGAQSPAVSAPRMQPRSVPPQRLRSSPQVDPRSASRQIEPVRQPPRPAAPATPSRFRWGAQDKPHAVTSAPGATGGVAPRPARNQAQ
jgi:hypothetical protein